MPSKAFSGKQKKQQLQEKRARKKDKAALGADTESDGSRTDDVEEPKPFASSDGHVAEYKQKFQKGGGNKKTPSNNSKAVAHDGRAPSSSTRDATAVGDSGGNPIVKDVYGGDKKGVRSEFKREHKKEVRERQQANYAPLVERSFIDEKGIPFGQWFKVANLSARRQFHTVVDGTVLGEGGYSSTFLYSIALPRRARMSGEDGKDIFADPNDDSDDYDQGPKGRRGRGATTNRGRGRHTGQKGVPEFTDSTTTPSLSSASGSDTEVSPSLSSAADTVETSTQTLSKKDGSVGGGGVKDLRSRLRAATAYDARERHVFRHWMNRIDMNFGVAHDARQVCDDAIEEDKGVVEFAENEETADIVQKVGRRNRVPAAVGGNDKNNENASLTAPRHPLAHLELNLFERNIDVWRQLWRTVESSDVVVAVADARYPVVHLPVSLFVHVIGECGKPMVVVLNKADLMTSSRLGEWKDFIRRYLTVAVKPLIPSDRQHLVDDLSICHFTCSPEAGTALASDKTSGRRKKRAPRNAKLYEELKAGESKKGQSLYAPSRKEMKGHRFDFAAEAKENDESASTSDSDAEPLRQELVIVKGMIDTILNECKAKGLTALGEQPVNIGFIGHPNVGKSSLINCIKGSKVVSVSATAGHTKHLQTVPLIADGVVLIDCPGLAFPVLGLPRPMQAVLGTHQIAQTRDPQSGIGYLGARLQLERIYGLRRMGHNPKEEDREPWSAYDLCEAYGCKKGFHVKKGKGAIDVHRAAIALLQEAYDGRLVLAFAPPAAAYLEDNGFVNVVRRYLYLDPEAI